MKYISNYTFNEIGRQTCPQYNW